MQVFFKDGSRTENIEVEFPIGHRRRRAESIPFLKEKFERNIKSRLLDKEAEIILQLFDEPTKLCNTKVNEFVDLWVTNT